LKAKINGINVEAPAGSTILEAATAAGIYIPTICNHPDIPPAGQCKVCVCKVNGSEFVLSCSTKLTDGMVVETDTPEVKAQAAAALEKFRDMPMYPRTPEIEQVFEYLDSRKPNRARKAEHTNAIHFDPVKCIDCGRCVRQCGDIQMIGALDEATHDLSQNECISCGQCTTVCPTQALMEHDDIPLIIRALAQGKTLILQTAPATRVAVGECFGDPVGTVSTGKVEITMDLKQDISRYHVILVEDIIDTGRTLKLVAEELRKRRPLSLKILTLLDKPSRRAVELEADKTLFTIPDTFVIGYGLDCAEYYRNLPYIAEYAEKET